MRAKNCIEGLFKNGSNKKKNWKNIIQQNSSSALIAKVPALKRKLSVNTNIYLIRCLQLHRSINGNDAEVLFRSKRRSKIPAVHLRPKANHWWDYKGAVQAEPKKCRYHPESIGKTCLKSWQCHWSHNSRDLQNGSNILGWETHRGRFFHFVGPKVIESVQFYFPRKRFDARRNQVFFRQTSLRHSILKFILSCNAKWPSKYK